MLNLGDKVRFVNENLEGIVTSLIDKNTIGVTVESDFEIPVAASQVVRINEGTPFGASPSKSIEKKKTVTDLPEGIYLVFETVSANQLQAWLVNNISEKLIFSLNMFEAGKYRPAGFGTIDRMDKEAIGKFSLDKLEKWPGFVFQFLFQDPEQSELRNPLEMKWKLKAADFHKSFRQFSLLEKQAYVFKLQQGLQQSDLEKLKDLDFAPGSFAKAKTYAKRSEAIIDLHIEKLHQDFQRMSNYEMLRIQKDEAIRFLEKSLSEGKDKVIFIHGVGKGALKNELWTMFKMHSSVRYIKEADQKEFGFGATEIGLK